MGLSLVFMGVESQSSVGLMGMLTPGLRRDKKSGRRHSPPEAGASVWAEACDDAADGLVPNKEEDECHAGSEPRAVRT